MPNGWGIIQTVLYFILAIVALLVLYRLGIALIAQL